MHITEKEHKKLKKIIEKDPKKVKEKEDNKSTPIWFDQEQKVIETSSEDEKEMDRILQELI